MAKVKPVLEPTIEAEPPIVQLTIFSPLLTLSRVASFRSVSQCGQIILFIFQYLLTQIISREKELGISCGATQIRAELVPALWVSP